MEPLPARRPVHRLHPLQGWEAFRRHARSPYRLDAWPGPARSLGPPRRHPATARWQPADLRRRQQPHLAFELQGVKRLPVMLTGWGATWGAASAAPFSHKLHLGLELPCPACHTAAAASTKASDNLLPAKAVCLQCHEDAQIPPPPPATRVATFSHAQHPKM